MCVPPPQPDTAAERAVFARLRALLEELNAAGHKLDTLSMGMSGTSNPPSPKARRWSGSARHYSEHGKP